MRNILTLLFIFFSVASFGQWTTNQTKPTGTTSLQTPYNVTFHLYKADSTLWARLGAYGDYKLVSAKKVRWQLDSLSNSLSTNYIKVSPPSPQTASFDITGSGSFGSNVVIKDNGDGFIMGTGSGRWKAYTGFAAWHPDYFLIANQDNGNGLKLSPSGDGEFDGSATATAFIKTGGTSAQYLLADGSVTTVAGSVYKGEMDGSTGSGLTDGTGTTGWYYACSVAGTHDYGSGNITLAIGDQLYYNGSVWLKIPGAGSYTLPIATASVLGGVKIGSGVSVTGGGVISVSTNYDPLGTASDLMDAHNSTFDHANFALKSITINGYSLASNITLNTSHIGSVSDYRYITDAEKANLHAPGSDNQDLSGLVPKTTTVNGKALTGNITLNPDDLNDASTTHKFVSSTDITNWNAKVSFPGFGTNHITAAYGDHNHTGVYEVPLTFSTGLNRTGNTITSTITQYTDALARNALSYASGTGNYNPITGVITIPNNTSQLTNGAGFITNINAGMISTALGYTPFNPANIYSWALAPAKPDYTADEISQTGTTNKFVTTSEKNTWNSKQSQLNGTGFVKASGTTISYDNTSYALLNGSLAQPFSVSSLTVESGTYDWTISGSSGTLTFSQYGGNITFLNGVITATNFQLSDRRLKTQIRPIKKAVLKDIDKVNIFQYRMKKDPEKLHFGVIAQDLETYFPDMVQTNDEGVKSVNYIEFLVAKIASLEERIKKLEDEK